MIKHFVLVLFLVLYLSAFEETNSDIRRFQIAVPDTTLEDLHKRLSNAILPDEVENENWEYGTNKK